MVKSGRPKSNNPKLTRLGVRVDDETLKQLNYLIELHECTKTDIIRKGIEIQYKENRGVNYEGKNQ